MLSVGNIRVGGTGKTPVVSALVATALKSGRKPAILARGYRSGLAGDEAGVFLAGKFCPLTPIAAKLEVVADEARLHSARHPTVPVIIGADRRRAFRLFCQQQKGGLSAKAKVDLVILEDGGQHLAIHRDLDLMLIDWQTTLASIRPLPSGDYREGLAVLKAAAAVIVTRCPPQNSTEWQQPPGRALWHSLPTEPYFAEFRLGSIYALHSADQADPADPVGPVGPVGLGDSTEGRGQNQQLRLHLLTGIAEPQRLYQQLKANPIALRGREGEARLVNHSFYGDHELLPIESMTPRADDAATDCTSDSLAGNVGWLITEKDLYRQEAQFRACRHPVWVVPLEVRVLTTATHQHEGDLDHESLWRTLIDSACQ